ncbi:sensor histidine kinase [Sulfuriferula sp. AH1]|uniref:sensor histidine kinase n=1 Tax=Sulfuriferula sp. AH1 TaxID=1985873 RepID=UPI000B3B996F|nr:histidine kinase [Sulfuriferula sp. AH1]ARU30446.1 sensor histidine kinase [Sulfuriferula sp. AH1]
MPKPSTADYPDRLPDFCNLGVMLRILLGVEGLVWTTAWLQKPYLAEMWHLFVGYSVVVQASLLLTLVLLCVLRRPLQRLPYHWGAVASMAVALITTALVMDGLGHLFADAHLAMTWREAVNVIVVSALLLGYFNLRGRALSPALTEARLQALQARIRPHFLFNSLNAVLSLVRSEPRRAERALENLADLFRVVMADNRQLSPLRREVEISRQYLELEGLRLGERLRVVWHIDKAPGNALVPPLLLQPLLENAVYHGIEPATQPGEISVNIYRSDGQLHLIIRNPYQHDGQRHSGNKMAMDNIKSRLMLHFDVEASLHTQIHDDYYQVHITLPYRAAP